MTKEKYMEKEKEFEEYFSQWMEEDANARKFFEEHPEKKEMYKRKWFDSVGDDL